MPIRPARHTHNDSSARAPLYTAEQRRRRDESRWTLVQGVLAPIQFVVFLVSLWLVLRYFATGDGLVAATVSIVIKTLLLYTIMITARSGNMTSMGVICSRAPSSGRTS